MPASHDVYCDQLSVLRRGFPLYYPDPPEGRSPIEIGDVGFTREGSFIRLFNASKPPNDPCNQLYGVPESFELLDLGDIHTYENALEYGPLHCNSVKTLAASLGTPGSVLPVEASIRFNCTSKQGADFNLTSALLALELEASGADCAIVHDDDWCMPTLEASQMIEQYTRFYFEELPLMLVAPADSSQLPDVDDSRNPGYTSPVIPQPEFNDTDESETDFEGSDWDRASGQETDETSIDGDDDFRDLFTTQEKPSLHPLLRGSQHGGPALVWDLRSDPVLASLRHAGAVPPLIPVTEDELLQPATTPPVSVLCVSCGIIPPSFTWGTITVHPNKKVVTVLDVLWNLRRTIRSPLTQREWGDLSKKQQQRVAAIFDSRWRETATPAETRAGGVLRQDCLLQHTVWAGLTLSPVEEDMAILTLRRPDSTL
ncbi:hypothetical protein DXG01_008140 [Tephrocybe rancida]|nr:hypothetical protein DXG01_008140 [Tephrocybe rancida]